jgi:3D (Asp-Asp-Asp) domain-containing protein
MHRRPKPVSAILLMVLILALELFLAACARSAHKRPSIASTARRGPTPRVFTATAYSLRGITASGTPTREGIVAADPKVLPLGSCIRVHGAGKHSKEYVVKDTGHRVKGRLIDIYMPSTAEAKRFGKRKVKLQVVGCEKSAP